MFLIYLDSSGRPIFSEKENYVLASVITNESNWQYIDNGIKAIKLRYFPDLLDEEVEIHVKDMLNRQGIYNGLKWEKIYGIIGEVFDFITDSKTELCVIAVLIDKTKLKKDKDIEMWAFRLLFERINRFIEKQNQKLIPVFRGIQYGITIVDSYGLPADQKLRKKLFNMLRMGTFYSSLTYLIEDPLFTDSKWRNLSQIVDCIAYCIRKKFRVAKKITLHEKYWYQFYTKLEKKFDKNRYGKYIGYGLKIFP